MKSSSYSKKKKKTQPPLTYYHLHLPHLHFLLLHYNTVTTIINIISSISCFFVWTVHTTFIEPYTLVSRVNSTQSSVTSVVHHRCCNQQGKAGDAQPFFSSTVLSFDHHQPLPFLKTNLSILITVAEVHYTRRK